MRQGCHDPVVGVMHLSSALLPFRNSRPFLRLSRCRQLGLSNNVSFKRDKKTSELVACDRYMPEITHRFLALCVSDRNHIQRTLSASGYRPSSDLLCGRRKFHPCS